MFRLPGGTDNPEHVETLRRPMCDGSHEGRWGPQCRQRRVQARVDAENPVEAGDLEDAQDPGSGGDDVERPAAHAHVLELADQNPKAAGIEEGHLGEVGDDAGGPVGEGLGQGFTQQPGAVRIDLTRHGDNGEPVLPTDVRGEHANTPGTVGGCEAAGDCRCPGIR